MKVFIVIDMQNDFISGALGNPQTLAVAEPMTDRVKEIIGEGTEILYTLDTHYENYNDTQEGKNLPVPHCIKGTEGHRLIPELMEIIGDESRAVEKITFGSKELPQRVIDVCGGVPDEIELAGVCTDICVISNAMILKTFFPETKIIVNSKCCAGVTPESHSRALEAMKMCQIDVI
ncbi:MAG: cysteine hydrolase [Ruminococcus sp.]|nr:cysteine hydrolase [Ruminococcus sp.]